jgi:alanine racemase
MDTKHLLSWIELSRAALNQNLDSLARLAGPKRKLTACVKANAYGHGLTEIVTLLAERKDLACLTVHSLDEAIECRLAGWRKSIILLGPAPLASMEAVVAHEVEPVVFTRESLAKLGAISNRLKQPIRTHLKLETGTGRQGVTDKQLPQFAALYKKYPYLKKPYGVSMHFANIEDTTNHAYAQEQLLRFNKLVQAMARLGIKPTIRHTASSAAMILFDKTRFEMVRPGIAVYGHWPSKETYLSYRLEGGINEIFTPVLTWKTRVTQIKDLPKDSFVGYGCTYRTTAPTRLAILPIGYADGYDRGLSNVAHVLIKGRRAPIRGRSLHESLHGRYHAYPGRQAGRSGGADRPSG